jgi:hypothetical protein
MNVTFYDASNDSVIGTDYNVPSGGIASTDWFGLAYETSYSWYAIADDEEYSTGSDTWSFTTRSDTPPGGMYIWDIQWREKNAGPNIFLYYTVTIRWDSDGDGVAEATDDLLSGATVYATLSMSRTTNSWSHSGITDASGQVEFGEKVGLGDYKAEVIDIILSGYSYTPDININNPSYHTIN